LPGKNQNAREKSRRPRSPRCGASSNRITGKKDPRAVDFVGRTSAVRTVSSATRAELRLEWQDVPLWQERALAEQMLMPAWCPCWALAPAAARDTTRFAHGIEKNSRSIHSRSPKSWKSCG